MNYLMEQYDVEIGKFYHFWDDGKSSISRHYMCKCEGIITVEESKELLFESYYWSEENNVSVALTLYDIWTKNKELCPLLYADDTPYFIVCSCPKYDDNILYFVKTKYGEWFSIDVQNWWQSGLLDYNENKLNSIINDAKEIIDNPNSDEKTKEQYRNYIKEHQEITY